MGWYVGTGNTFRSGQPLRTEDGLTAIAKGCISIEVDDREAAGGAHRRTLGVAGGGTGVNTGAHGGVSLRAG